MNIINGVMDIEKGKYYFVYSPKWGWMRKSYKIFKHIAKSIEGTTVVCDLYASSNKFKHTPVEHWMNIRDHAYIYELDDDEVFNHILMEVI